MEMNLTDNADKNQSVKKEISTILENWRGIYSKEHTSVMEGIKKCSRRKFFTSSDKYMIWYLCKAEGRETFRAIYNEYSKPFEKEPFVRIQKTMFLNRLENDCRKLTWYLNEITTSDNVHPLVADVLDNIADIGTLLEEALAQAWEENQIMFTVVPFYEIKKAVEVYEFDYEPASGILATTACNIIGIKTYEYDISSAVNTLEFSMEDMPAEADRIAIKAVDSMLARKIVEPMKFILSVM